MTTEYNEQRKSFFGYINEPLFVKKGKRTTVHGVLLSDGSYIHLGVNRDHSDVDGDIVSAIKLHNIVTVYYSDNWLWVRMNVNGIQPLQKEFFRILLSMVKVEHLIMHIAIPTQIAYEEFSAQDMDKIVAALFDNKIR